MPETDIGNAEVGNQAGTETLFSVDPVSTDGPLDQDETEYINFNWTKQLGFYKKIPELKSAIDAKTKWTIGKGFTSNEITEMAFLSINGHGKDSFNSILKNQDKVMEIGGDSYAEIIRDEDTKLINLKPLNPEFIKIVAGRNGMIKRYEQINRITKKKIQSWPPEQIFHLSRDRVADEIHGVSVVDAVEETMIARNEAIRDYRKLLRRNVYPVRVHYVDTDDPTEITNYKAKADKIQYEGENFIVPKGAVEIEISAVATNQTLNPLPWINVLTQNFYQEVGVPQIIVGGAQEITEASAKIAYLAWEQTVEDKQLYLEEQVLAQLNLEINLEFPASLQNELLSDNRKGETMQASTPEDTSITNTGIEGGEASDT